MLDNIIKYIYYILLDICIYIYMCVRAVREITRRPVNFSRDSNFDEYNWWLATNALCVLWLFVIFINTLPIQLLIRLYLYRYFSQFLSQIICNLNLLYFISLIFVCFFKSDIFKINLKSKSWVKNFHTLLIFNYR